MFVDVRCRHRVKEVVGAIGFEPTASWSRTRRASQAALRPDGETLTELFYAGEQDCATQGLASLAGFRARSTMPQPSAAIA